MAVTISGGIDQVSYRYAAVESSGGFPVQKANLTVTTSIPSRVDEVFGLNGSQKLIEDAVRPKVANADILSPARFTALCSEIDPGANGPPNSAEERKILSAAQALLSEMRGNNALFQSARFAQIAG